MPDTEVFQPENLAKLHKVLSSTEEDLKSAMLKEDMELLRHQAVGMNWLANMEDGLTGGGLLAEDLGTGKALLR
jgi:hypothetical protein